MRNLLLLLTLIFPFLSFQGQNDSLLVVVSYKWTKQPLRKLCRNRAVKERQLASLDQAMSLTSRSCRKCREAFRRESGNQSDRVCRSFELAEKGLGHH